MSGEKGSTYANGLLQMVFQNVVSNAAIAAIGSGLQASTTAGTLYWSLHTADPLAGGSQTTNEVAYTGYARVGLTRGSGNYTVTTNSVSPAATVSFPACTGGTATATYFAIGTASSGAGELLYAGPITPNISIASGVTPQLTTSTAITES